MKSAGKARNNGLYRHIKTSKEIIRNLLNDSIKNIKTVLTEENGFVIITSIRFIFLQKRTKFYFVG